VQAVTGLTIAREGIRIMLYCKSEFSAILFRVISFVAEPTAVQDVACSLQRGQLLQQQGQAGIAACG
jgi:hypothetical protein